jgi:hypothetical protein
MRRKASEIFLAALVFELSLSTYNALLAAESDSELEQAVYEAYALAHFLGAVWCGLVLTGAKFPSQTKKQGVTVFQTAIKQLAQDSGVKIPKVTFEKVIRQVEAQAETAKSKIIEARVARASQLDRTAETRAVGYAARWGVQQGIADMAENSSAFGDDGQEVELLKTWVRLATRVERRTWHDALIGKTILYSQKFKISSPRGTFFVGRPYDSSLPLSEKIGCGHGIRVEPPRGASIQLWDGS